MANKLVCSFAIEDHGIRKMKVGDVNNDGEAELIFAQSYPMNREICAVTAVDLKGNVLWEHGELLPDCNWAYSDIPFEIVDWDQDGKNEVVYIKQAYYKNAHMWCYSKGDYVDKMNPTYDELRFDPDLATERAFEYEGCAYLMVLDGCTGAVKEQVPVPAPADDSIGFGFFDGTGKMNLMAKDRYWNIWAISHEGEILWQISDKELGLHGLGHYPAIGDIDGDGLDELFITSILVDHDGSIQWRVPGVPCHHDGAVILSNLPEPRLMTIADKLRMIDSKGNVIWERNGGHLQCLYCGCCSTDPKHGPYQFVVLDQAYQAKDYFEGCELLNKGLAKGQRVTMYDWNGDVIWTKVMDDQPAHGIFNWMGNYDSVFRCINGAVEILDMEGNVMETLPFTDENGAQLTQEEPNHYEADICGDGRDEIVLYGGRHVSHINVYTNPAAWNFRRHYNHSGYQYNTIR